MPGGPTGRLLAGCLWAVVFLTAVVKIEDTDAWTHLALGRALAAQQGFPATEAFNFPSLHLPYYNTEWLFGLVLYLLWAAAGPAGVIGLKAAVVTLGFVILWKDALCPADAPARRGLGAAAAVLVLVPVLLTVRHRFVERPDIALMVFLAFTIYALDAYVHEGRRWLYWLPALQVVWVNMHPSVVVGLVPFVAVLAGGGAQRLLARRWGLDLPGTPSPRQLRAVALVLAAVGLAALVNPYGVEPFHAPFKLAGSAWLRHEVAELQPPRLGRENAPFVLLGLLGLGFILTARRLSLVSLLLVAPFAYLGLSARRFIFLFAVVAAPVLARQARALLGRLPEGWARRGRRPAAALAAAVVLAVPVLWATGVPPFDDPLKAPGIGVNHLTVPEGALRYLDGIGASGRVFNTFQWGGYIVWRDFPRRIALVDGRGYVPPEILEDALAARSTPARFAALQARYGFEIAVVDYPVLGAAVKADPPAGDLAMASADWALVYWDDTALVYLRRAGPWAPAVARDEYRHVTPANGAAHLRARVQAGVPLEAIEAELRRNIRETGSWMGVALLGFLYNDAGRHAQAIETFGRVPRHPAAWNALANVYQGLGFAHWRLGDAPRAQEYYRRAARLREEPELLYNLGVVSASLGQDHEAIRRLERALALEPNLAAAYPALAAAYRRTGRPERAQKVEAASALAERRARAQGHFTRGVRLYLDGDHPGALREFARAVELDPTNAPSLSNLGWVYFDLGRLEEAFLQQHRALQADPAFANAHYGLAMIHERRGDRGRARAHFAEYLRLDPRGYFSRRAQEAIRRLSPS